MQAPAGSNIAIYPTFNPRSNGGNLSEIAAKISQDDTFNPPLPPPDSDFAFAACRSSSNSILSSPVPADQIFQNGVIRPLYNPTPNYTANNVVLNCDPPSLPDDKIPDIPPPIRSSGSRNPLRKLFGEERHRNVPHSDHGLNSDAAVEAARPKRNALAAAAGNFHRRLKFIGLHIHMSDKKKKKHGKETPSPPQL